MLMVWGIGIADGVLAAGNLRRPQRSMRKNNPKDGLALGASTFCRIINVVNVNMYVPHRLVCYYRRDVED